MMNMRLTFTAPAWSCTGKYLASEVFFYLPDASPVSLQIQSRRPRRWRGQRPRRLQRFEGGQRPRRRSSPSPPSPRRPPPPLAARLHAVAIKATKRMLWRRQQGGSLRSMQPYRCVGADDPMHSDPLPFPAVRAMGEPRRHTAFLALSTALPVACLLAAPSLAAAGPMRPSRRRASRPSFPVVRAVPPSRAWGLPPLASLAAASPTQLSHGRPLWLP